MSDLLVIDVGTSGVRACIVSGDAQITHERYRELLPDSPASGLVEFDASLMADTVLDLVSTVLSEREPVAAVGIANQRASTILWDRTSGEPLGPGIGWQDLRTIGECLALQAQGYRIAPNQSATKLAWLLDQHDPDRTRDLCFGTVDSWIAWTISGGRLHITDASNAAVSGLATYPEMTWDERLLEILRIPPSCLPNIVDSTGDLGEASALQGAPPIRGMAGDQQASLIGQGCVETGPAKITFGTGGMLDLVVGPTPPAIDGRGEHGTFPIVAWCSDKTLTWGIEAIMLSAGSNVEWLRDDLGIIESAADSHEVASQCDTAEGVVYVPALLGLGTPQWDYGARGTLLGVTRGTGRPHVVRAVLEGIAHRGADLVEAAEADAATTISHLRIDGGMSQNPTFVQALADASQRQVEISPVVDATTLGAAFLAGLASGMWTAWSEIGEAWSPARTVDPAAELDRDQWREALGRAQSWFGDLTALDF